MKRNIIQKLLLINIIITFGLFYLFEENRHSVLEFGTRASNLFFVRCTIQVIILTVMFYFSIRKNQTAEKQ